MRVVDNPRVHRGRGHERGSRRGRPTTSSCGPTPTRSTPRLRAPLGRGAARTSGADWRRRAHAPRRSYGLRSGGGRRDHLAVRRRPRPVPLRRRGPGRRDRLPRHASTGRSLEEVGGYDETELQWAAEDQELHYRLRRAGRRIRLDPAIRSWYFPRQTAEGALAPVLQLRAVQGVDPARSTGRLPYWRPLAPAALVAGTAAAVGVGVVTRRRRCAAGPGRRVGRRWPASPRRLGRRPGRGPASGVRARSVICHWALRRSASGAGWAASSPDARSTPAPTGERRECRCPTAPASGSTPSRASTLVAARGRPGPGAAGAPGPGRRRPSPLAAGRARGSRS